MKKFDGAQLDLSGYQAFLVENFKDYRNIDELDYDLNGNNQLNPLVAGKWYLRPPYHNDYGWANELFRPNMVSLEPNGSGGQFLRLTAKTVTQTTVSPFPPANRQINYLSGMIRSAPLPFLDYNHLGIDSQTGVPPPEFATGFIYGVFEIRARLPLENVAGVWPALWLFSGHIELDFLDNLKAHPAQGIQSGTIVWVNSPEHASHNWTNEGAAINYPNVETVADYAASKYYYKDDVVVYRGNVYTAKNFVRATAFGNYCPKTEGPTLADGFNTYTTVWTPTEITFFLNGYKIYSTTKEYAKAKAGVPQLYITLQMAEWARWFMSGPETYMDIESIRVYKPIGYQTPAYPYTQNPAWYNFRFHDKTTIFNNLSSLNSTFDETLYYIEKAESDLILLDRGDKLYFRSKFNRLSNFYFDVPAPNNPSPKKWNFNCLDWDIINVVDNVVHHPTEDRLFYRGKNPTNGHSVWSFYFESGIWKNQNLSSTGLDNVAGDIVVSPDGKQVYYRSKNDRICYFEKVGMAWQHFDTVPTIYNVRGNVVHSLTQSKRIYYQGFDNRLYNFYIDNGV